jgi:hypothetical protein
VSLPFDLCMGNVEIIVDRLGLTEVAGTDTPERLVLTSPMVPDAPVGRMRIWEGEDCQLVYVGLSVEMIRLDSHMMFAFLPPTSAVPHFTLDSVGNDEDFAFHLDLIPRLDLGANLAYMDHCYTPLTEIREATMAIEGLSRANISPRQWALMSEWMIVNRASQPAFEEISATVAAYREHWLGLVAGGVPAEVVGGVSPEQIAERDRANRDAIFNPDVDAVWERVSQLVGDEQSEQVRRTLATQGALVN